MIPETCLAVLGNIGSDQPEFALFDTHVGLVERNVAVAEAFDLGANKDNSAFDLLKNFETMASLSIFGNRFGLRSGAGGFLLFLFG